MGSRIGLEGYSGRGLRERRGTKNFLLFTKNAWIVMFDGAPMC